MSLEVQRREDRYITFCYGVREGYFKHLGLENSSSEFKEAKVVPIESQAEPESKNSETDTSNCEPKIVDDPTLNDGQNDTAPLDSDSATTDSKVSDANLAASHETMAR